MKFISICSGIEAASVAFSAIGWEAVAFSEIEPFPCALLAHHYPDIPNFGDMTKFREWPEEVFAQADMIVGGPPCQSFSVAGKREGLNDGRGNLTLIYTELIDHADTIRLKHGKPPVIILYENVPGLLSDKTGAFGCFLGELAGESCALEPSGGRWTNAGFVLGPKRAIAWRVTDAQYFGVAQRRRRVFVVASARDGFDPAKVLFEFDGVRRDIAPSREQGQKTTGDAGAGAKTASHWDGIENPHPTLSQSHNTGGIGASNQELFSQRGAGLVQQGFRKLTFESYAQDETASTMMARDYKSYTDLVAYSFDSLSSNSMKNSNPHSGCREVNLSKTLDTTIPCPSKNQGGLCVVGTQNDYFRDATDNLAPTLRSGSGGGVVNQAVATATAVRRLTPVECERLMGFPDGYTAIPWRGKSAEDCPDGHRYKALGNSWAVPNVRWIGARIAAELNR